MERHYALPMSFAAAFHAALLFGFSKPPRPPAIVRIPVVIGEEFPVPREDDEVVAAEAAESAARRPASIEKPPPTQPEPPAIDVTTAFRVPVPPLQPTSAEFDPTRLVPSVAVRRPGNGDGDGDWGDVIPTLALDKPPRTRFQPAPLYPAEAKYQGLRGDVVVEFIVDEHGRVHDPRVISSSSRVFEEPALRGVAKWVFEPGLSRGRVVRFRMSVPVVFNLNE